MNKVLISAQASVTAELEFVGTHSGVHIHVLYASVIYYTCVKLDQ